MSNSTIVIGEAYRKGQRINATIKAENKAIDERSEAWRQAPIEVDTDLMTISVNGIEVTLQREVALSLMNTRGLRIR